MAALSIPVVASALAEVAGVEAAPGVTAEVEGHQLEGPFLA
ncbi:MAG: hypothetical protein R3B91_05495 [Planctomycetaceae bacterium]